MIYENTPAFWRSVAVDATVTLTDKLTLAESQKAGDGIGGRLYTVDRILSVAGTDDDIHDIQWLFFELDANDEILWLMVKIVGDRDLDIRVYSETDVVSGDRLNIAEHSSWLFALVGGDCIEDLDEESFDELDFCELSYSDAFNLEMVSEEGEDIECEFCMKPQGEFTGTVTNETDQLVTLVEYECNNAKCQESDCVLLEIGHYENENGGAVRLMTGNSILPTEIDVL